MSEDTFDLMAAFSEQAIRIKTIELAIDAALASGNSHEPVTEADIVNTLTPILKCTKSASDQGSSPEAGVRDR